MDWDDVGDGIIVCGLIGTGAFCLVTGIMLGFKVGILLGIPV